MTRKILRKTLAFLIVAVMVVGIFPASVFATETTSSFVSETHDVFSRTTSTIAPGVTQDIVYAYAKDGKQMVYYVATADVNRDDVVVKTSYKDQYLNQQFGMQKLSEQIAYADELYADETSDRFVSEYYKTVAGVNASFYNMTTGQPSGVTYLDGIQIGESASYNQFFAILKDGTPIIDYKSTLSSYEGQIDQAVAGSAMLVWDGKDVTASANGSYNTDRHSRTCVGVTADSKVVMMTLDGRQEPFSCGGTMHELAQIMLEAGCVKAINLDGGGSSTFAARQEGENEVTIVNRPSDGSERSISSGLIIGSLAVPSNVFQRATLSAENEYVTPGSEVTVTAKGVSPAGTAADIPEGVEWQLADSAMGTVTNGVFVSNGTVGDVEVQLVYQGNVVGSTTIHVVVPDKLAFNNSVITVPYAKTVPFELTATYGLNEVAINESDIVLALSDASIGTINGLNFTACAEDETITGGTVTATLVFDSNVSCSATITLGKGSEIVQDFEAGVIPDSYNIKTGYPQYGPAGSKKDENGNYYYNGQNEIGSINIVTAENGKVHDGEYAMAVNCDFSQPYETGYHLLNLSGFNFEVPANAQTLGMWIYLPELEELYASSMRFVGTGLTSKTSVNSPWLWDNCEPYGWENDGWRYVTMDISGYNEAIKFNTLQIYICDRDNTDVGFTFKDNASVNGKFTYYIDSITVDYSSAVDDREPPVFTSVRYADTAMSDAVELKGQSVKDSNISFTAIVAENTEKSNYTGLDANSVKAYVDGVAVDYNYSDGTISVQDIVLADGVHTVRFEASDNLGNMAYVERQITVNAGSDIPTISVVPQNSEADKILIGSLYWVDLVADNAKNVDTATVTFNLNSVSTWELEHMVVTKGFEAEYSIDEVSNNATVTVKKVDVVADDATVLVQMPIRTWESKITQYEGYESQTPEKLWSRKIIWPIDIKLSADYGSVKFTDGTEGSFSMAPIAVITELYGNYGELNANGDYANKTSWHIHTAEAVADKTATCTEDGYTGRTFCSECNSVVDWGTSTPKTGHNYSFVNGVLTCDCEKLYNGEYEGVFYVDGVKANGWVDNSYYADGVKYTGIKLVDGYYYDFGENGVCDGKSKFTGLFFDEDAKAYRYSKLGVLTSGWSMIDNEWYYFRSTMNAANGSYTISGVEYQFEETGRLVSGVWVTDSKGTKYSYGPAYYYEGWKEIDGKTYYFDNHYRFEGYRPITESNSHKAIWFEFDENGALVGRLDDYTALHELNGKLYYVVNGESQRGLQLIDGEYYYFNSSYAAVTGDYYVTTNNGLLPSAKYNFGTDGKLQHNIVTEDGNMYYCDAMGNKLPAGLVACGNTYMYVRSNAQLATGTYYTYNTNGLLNSANYAFTAEGKMKHGIVEENGSLYYYVLGNKNYAGLIEIDGDYYYVNGKCQVVTGEYYVTKNNGLMESAKYKFGADGKMLNGIVEEDGTLYYYVNGLKNYAGLIQIDGDYYYVNGKCQVVTGEYYVTKNNGLMESTKYKFGADGKMLNGIVEEDGTLYYYVNGLKNYAGLIQIDGDYYYVNGKCQVVTGEYYVTKNNGYMDSATYSFDDTGKMIIG